MRLRLSEQHCNHQRALLFDRYLTSHFSQDPFMQALEQGLPAGVWTLAQVSQGRLDPEYRHHFYQATGWQEEVGPILPVRDGLTLMLFLGRLDKRSTLSQSELARLKQLFPLVHSLCRQQWQQSQPLLAQSSAQPDSASLKSAVEQAMASVGGIGSPGASGRWRACCCRGWIPRRLPRSSGLAAAR
jgi:hypothetical protein